MQGCDFNVLLGRCDRITTIVSYCASNDSVCASCSVSSSRPVCMGADGRCICPTLCSVMPTVRSSCRKDEVPIATVWLGFGLFAFALPFLLYAQRKCNEPRGGIQHMMYNRRRRRQHRRRERERDTTRALTLAEWRDHRELHKLELGEVELKTCYLLLQDVKQSAGVQPERSPASSSSDEGDAVESESHNRGGEELEMVGPERVSEHFDDQEEESKLDNGEEGSDTSDREHVSVAVNDRR